MKKLFTLSIALLLCYVVQAQFYNNGGTLSISTGGVLQVNNAFTNKSGGNLVNNGALTIKGNLTNEQTMSNAYNGTLTLGGSSTQTISGTAPILVKNLTFNNAAGITLSKALKADGEVKFQSGIVAVSSSTEPLSFTSNGTVSATNSPTNTSHVNGYVLKEGTGVFDFPVGDGTRFQKVGANLTANATGLLVKYNATDAGTGTFATTGASATALTSYNTQEHWDISPLSTATGAVTIYWDDYKTPTLTDVSLVKVAHKSGANWLNEGGTGTGTTSAGSVTSSNITTWSPFALGTISTTQATTLTLGTATNPTTCSGTGSIAFTSTGYTAGNQTLSYTRNGETPALTQTVTIANDGSFTLSNLTDGVYSNFAIGATTATGSRTLTLPASCYFITRWDLSKSTGSGGTQIRFDVGTTGTVNYTWTEVGGGGAVGLGTFTNGTATITGLPSGGTIDLSISPTNFNHFSMSNALDKARLTQTKQWGTTAWASMETAFDMCTNMTLTATDVPNTAAVTNMSKMFRGCTSFNQALPVGFNTANVTNMEEMFYDCLSYNQALPASFNTEKVTNMSGMFSGCGAYNQALPASFNTVEVTNMSRMFAGCTIYDQALPESFNTAKVTNMNGMFQYCLAYNQPLPASFNTEKVTGMNSMFSGCTAYNQALPASFNTEKVTNMSAMFSLCTAFNQALPASFNTANVTDMSAMFDNCTAYNQALPVSFNTANVTNMEGMFYNCRVFNQPLPASFNTENVTNMSAMFAGCTVFNQPLPAGFKCKVATNVSYLFANASAFNQNLVGRFIFPDGNINMEGLFDNCGLDVIHYTAVKVDLYNNILDPRRGSWGGTVGAAGMKFCPVFFSYNAVTSAYETASNEVEWGGYFLGFQGDAQSSLCDATGIVGIVGSNPTNCSSTDGKIAFTTTTLTGAQTLSYKKDGNATTAPINITNTNVSIGSSTVVRGVFELTGLGAGVYSDFAIGVATTTESLTLGDPTVLPTLTRGTVPAICAGATSFTIPYTATTNSPTRYSISGSGITPVTDATLGSSPITVALSAAANTSTPPSYSLTVKNANGCISTAYTGTVTVNVCTSLTLGSPTNPTTCGGTDGKIAFTTTGLTGTQTLSYKKDGVAATADVTIASNAFELTGLGAGTYTEFAIGATTATGSHTLSDPSAPTFTLGTAVKPTTCGGTNGSIPLNGLANSTSYSVSYQKDGATAVVQTLSSNASGVLTLSNLGAGAYTNITVTLGGCTSAASSTTISNPSYSLVISTPTNPTACGATDGKIAFTYGLGTIPDGTYSMSYSLGGSTFSKNVQFGSAGSRVSAETSSSATTFLTGLGAGSYSNFQITINGCTVTPTGTQPVELTAPSAPTFTLGTAVKPTTCGGTDGSLPLTSLANSTSYSVSYQKDGADAVVQTLSSNASGVLTLSNLGAGAYTNITVTLGGCTSTASSTTISNPSYSLVISTPTNPTACSATDGKIAFTYGLGTIPDGTYSMTYRFGGSTFSKDVTFGTPAGRISAETSSSATAFLTGLGAGSYSHFFVTINGCTVTPTGTQPVELTAPSAPTFTLGTPIKPTTCNATDGSLPLNGLTASTSYSVSYQKDGATAVVQTLSSNASSVLMIPNLGVGSYTNIKVTLNNCESATATATIAAPTFTLTAGTPNNPTTCGDTGSIPFTTTLPGGTYSITYKKDGVSQTGSVTVSSSIRVAVGAVTSNSFTLGSLGAGTYTDFKIVHGGCDVIAAGPVTLNDPTGPTAFNVTGDSSFCTGGTSSVVGLSGSQTGVNYQLKRGSDNVGVPVAGSGSAISFGNQATTGVYTVVATNTMTLCSTSMTGSATISTFPQPQASLSGNATVCKDNAPSLVSFTATVGTAPYIFSYKINNGTTQTISSNTATATLLHPTNVSGVFEYSLVSLQDGNGCSQVQSGSITVNVLTKPNITLVVNAQTLNEGNTQTLCDTDSNPVNGLQFAVSGACVSGSPLWRVQVGNGAWSAWSATAPVSQLSNNQPHRYQAACDANCPSTYTNPIELTINYRASVPQNVSLVADGTMVAAGESKEICNVEGNTITFNATCAADERLLYSVDGGSYLPTVPSQIVDGQFHNYRVRCQKTDGTPSCVETESGVMRLKISSIATAPVASLSLTSGCGTPTSFTGTATCPAGFTAVWYNAATNVALPNLPVLTPNETTSYYARCQNESVCQSANSNTVTFTLTPVNEAPVVNVSSELVCTGQDVTVSTSCPAGANVLWNTGVSENSFKVAFNNITTQSYSAKCVFANGCQSPVSASKSVRWKAFELTIINIGQSKSATKTNDRAAWAGQFVSPDGGPSLDNSSQQNPTLYFTENPNKTGPRYWTINVDACALGSTGSLTFDMLVTPETGVVRSYNTHENNAPYFMYANREGWTELYAQNHPAYGFYEDNGVGGNVYDTGLPKGLYKLGVRYWDMKGWGSIYPSTRKPQGSVLAYQEYWFRIQSKEGVGVGAARVAADLDSSHRRTDGMTKGAFASVMPNPVSNVLRLKVTDTKAQKVSVSLVDASGRTMLQRTFVPETHQHQEEFEVSDLANGMYFLKVNAGDKQATLKVVKVQ